MARMRRAGWWWWNGDGCEGFGGMPPKAKAAKKKKAPKEKKPKAEGEKKKGRKKRRSESYSIYIYKVLKQGGVVGMSAEG
jgi:hypothetical protein